MHSVAVSIMTTTCAKIVILRFSSNTKSFLERSGIRSSDNTAWTTYGEVQNFLGSNEYCYFQFKEVGNSFLNCHIQAHDEVLPNQMIHLFQKQPRSQMR